jgi:hypothetical protein
MTASQKTPRTADSTDRTPALAARPGRPATPSLNARPGRGRRLLDALMRSLAAQYV